MCHMSISHAHVAIFYTVDVIICVHVPRSYHRGRYLIANIPIAILLYYYARRAYDIIL